MQEQQYLEIDVIKLLMAIWRRIIVVILAAVLLAGIGYSYARFLITPLYRADVMLYVNNSDISVGNTNVKLSGGDLSTSRDLVATYEVILTSRATINEVARVANVDYDYEALKNMITAGAVDGTEIFRVEVTDADPNEAVEIANAVAKVLPERIATIVDGSSARIVDYAVIPSQRCSPSYSKYTAFGGLAGAAIVCAWIVLRELLDDEIHEEEDLTQEYPTIPVLAVIPDLLSRKETGYGGYYHSEEKQQGGVKA